MANDVGTGSRSYVSYAYEPTFNEAATDANLTRAFGHNIRFSNSPRNNIERIPTLNSRNYAKYAAKKFEGTFSADFQVSNGSFLRGVIGEEETTGSEPYFHKFSESNTPSGATIQISEDLDADSERTLTGCLFDKLTLTMNKDEVVSGRIDGIYANESKDTSLNSSGVTTPDEEDVFTFANASLTLSGATTITEIESLELTVSNNAELISGLGSRIATQRAFKQRVYEVRITKVREQDSDFLNGFYGSDSGVTDPTTPASGGFLDIVLDNGLGGASERSIRIRLGSFIGEDSTIPIAPAEINKESITLFCTELNGPSGAVYTDNTVARPLS